MANPPGSDIDTRHSTHEAFAKAVMALVPTAQGWVDNAYRTAQTRADKAAQSTGGASFYRDFILMGHQTLIASLGDAFTATNPGGSAGKGIYAEMGNRYSFDPFLEPSNLEIQTASQQFMVTASHKLDLKLKEPWLYTPEKGAALIEALVKTNKQKLITIVSPRYTEVSDNLTSLERIKDTQPDRYKKHHARLTQEKAAIEAQLDTNIASFKDQIQSFVSRADSMHAQGLLSTVNLVSRIPPRISNFAQGIFADFAKDHPSLKGILDTALRDFTNTVQLSDMGVNFKNPHNNLAAALEAAYKTHGPGILDEIENSKLIDHVLVSPFGNESRRRAFQDAFEAMIKRVRTEAAKNAETSFVTLFTDYNNALETMNADKAMASFYNLYSLAIDPGAYKMPMPNGVTAEDVRSKLMAFNQGKTGHTPMIYTVNGRTDTYYIAAKAPGGIFSIAEFNVKAYETALAQTDHLLYPQQLKALQDNPSIGDGFSLLFPKDGPKRFVGADTLLENIHNPYTKLQGVHDYHKLIGLIDADLTKRNLPLTVNFTDASAEGKGQRAGSKLAKQFEAPPGEKALDVSDAKPQGKDLRDKMTHAAKGGTPVETIQVSKATPEPEPAPAS